jgi:hypothetical protein
VLSMSSMGYEWVLHARAEQANYSESDVCNDIYLDIYSTRSAVVGGEGPCAPVMDGL